MTLRVDDVTLWLKGGIIDTPEIARKFAELILEHRFGKEELERQLPLTVEDRNTTWFIQGSWNRDKLKGRIGPFDMTIRKQDAQIIDVGIAAGKLSPKEEEFERRLQESCHRPSKP